MKCCPQTDQIDVFWDLWIWSVKRMFRSPFYPSLLPAPSPVKWRQWDKRPSPLLSSAISSYRVATVRNKVAKSSFRKKSSDHNKARIKLLTFREMAEWKSYLRWRGQSDNSGCWQIPIWLRWRDTKFRIYRSLRDLAPWASEINIHFFNLPIAAKTAN